MATPQVTGLLILDQNDGSRIHAKYFGSEMRSKPAAQLNFERGLFSKTRSQTARGEAEIVMINGQVCVFRTGIDVIFYVIGGLDENELVLVSVLDGMYNALNGILRSHVDKKTLLDNLDIVLLTADELVDGGMILESDPSAIVNRVQMRGGQGSSNEQVPVQELTIQQALMSAREQFTRSFQR